MTMTTGGEGSCSNRCCTTCGKGPRYDDKNNPLRLQSCSRCKSVWYHDANCQAKDWPRHKHECKQLQQLRQQRKQQKQKQQQQAQLPSREEATTPKVNPSPRRRRSTSSRRRSIPSFQASKCKKYARWYHKMAEQHRLGSITELTSIQDDRSEELLGLQEETTSPYQGDQGGRRTASSSKSKTYSKVQQAKSEILSELNRTMGETNTDAINTSLETLLSNYDSNRFDPRRDPTSTTRTTQQTTKDQISMEGIGVSAGKPTFPGCIGKNDRGDPMYKLGTMAFDMFRPTQLVVSVQGTFLRCNIVNGKDEDAVKHVPSSLLQEVRHGKMPVRTYDVITAFTIEPWRPDFGDDSPNKDVDEAIQGIMTTYGFALPYPKHNRFSVWFTGGCIEVGDGGGCTDQSSSTKWFELFGNQSRPSRSILESSRLFAAKLFVGANANDTMDEETGRLSYELTRPIASHIDLLYLDETLQILRGSSGTLYVHVRLVNGRRRSDSNAELTADLIPNTTAELHEDDHDEYHHGNNNKKITNMKRVPSPVPKGVIPRRTSSEALAA